MHLSQTSSLSHSDSIGQTNKRYCNLILPEMKTFLVCSEDKYTFFGHMPELSILSFAVSIIRELAVEIEIS